MKKILIINANYYDNLTKIMVSSAKNILKKEKFNLSLLSVSGIFEIPIAIRKNVRKFDGFIVWDVQLRERLPILITFANPLLMHL